MPHYEQSIAPVAGSLKVVELFETVQGEGKFIGVPSVFFRTGMCNLECKGCDTKWDSWKETSIQDCAKQIAQYLSKHVVITGGEPTLWQPQLAELIHRLDRAYPNYYTFTIESNGAVPITNEFLLERVDLWSFSPKVGSLGHEEKFSRNVVIENIKRIFFNKAGRPVQLKYVLDPNIDAHVDSVFDFQERVNENVIFPDINVYFQPYDRGTLVNIYARQVAFNINEEYNRDLRKLTDLVMQRSGSRFRVVPQLHKYTSMR